MAFSSIQCMLAGNDASRHGESTSTNTKGLPMPRHLKDAQHHWITVRLEGFVPLLLLAFLLLPARVLAQTDEPAFNEGNARTMFRNVAGLQTTYVNYVNVSKSSSYKEQFLPGLSFYHSSIPLPQDAEHMTSASREVLPKSEIGGTVTMGPLYSDAPTAYQVLLEGAVLLTPVMALGGSVSYERMDDEHTGWGMWTSTIDRKTLRISPSLVFYPSAHARCKESFGLGSYSETQSFESPGSSSDVYEESMLIMRFEHVLSLAPTPSFAYGHTLRYTSLSPSYETIDFLNRFEFPQSENVTLGFQANMFLFGENYSKARPYKRITLGPDCLVLPMQRLQIRIAPLYTLQLEDSRDEDYGKQQSFFSLFLSAELRFP